MASFQSWKCSWSSVAAVASLVLLVSLVHMFLTPLFPSSLDYFGAPRNSCLPVNRSVGGSSERLADNSQLNPVFDPQLLPDSHGAVTYRAAPWKPEIGRWLSSCDSITTAIDVVESIGGKSCEYDCNGQGICNRELGQCRCFHGFDGSTSGCGRRSFSTEGKRKGCYCISI